LGKTTRKRKGSLGAKTTIQRTKLGTKTRKIKRSLRIETTKGKSCLVKRKS